MLNSPVLAAPSIRHGFFTRDGGVSAGIYAGLNCGPGSGDDPAAVIENRRRVSLQLAGAETPLCSLYQVHGARAVAVTAPWDADNRPQADAMVTDRPGLILGILTADCTPVLFADPEARVIGAAHAGWKGALGGVLSETVLAMERLGAVRSRIRAAIGPTIARASYEVSHDFRAGFLAADPVYARFFTPGQKEGHAQFDLPGFVQSRLDAEHLAAVDNLGVDTYPEANHLFSYRRTTHRAEKDYGRQISTIMIAPG